MKFLKQIKGKVLSAAFSNNDKKKQRQKMEQQRKEQKQASTTPLSKQLFSNNKGMDQLKNGQPSKINLNEQKRFYSVTSPTNFEMGRQIVEEHNGIKQEYKCDEESAVCFIANLCSRVAEIEKERKLRVIKARNANFCQLQMQPIYMLSHCEYKILSMELQIKYGLMIERTQELVLQKSVLDRTIQNTLLCGYLWQAYGYPNIFFIQACYETVLTNSAVVGERYERVIELRQKLRQILGYFLKISNLNKRRIIIAKKLKLLQRIKSYKKDIELKFQNIDQAFYIQRSRQKLYSHLVKQQKLVNKVKLLQNMLKKIKDQNKKMKCLIESQLSEWIDGGGEKEKERKQVEKLLILLYFVKTQKMYVSNGIVVAIDQITNRAKLIEEINVVKKWEGYKYVNDKYVKIKVTEFLDALLKELSEKQSGEQSVNGKTIQKIQVINKSSS